MMSALFSAKKWRKEVSINHHIVLVFLLFFLVIVLPFALMDMNAAISFYNEYCAAFFVRLTLSSFKIV